MTANSLRAKQRPWSLDWLLRTIRSGWILILLAAVSGAALGLLSTFRTSGYQASATISVVVGSNTTETSTAVRSIASLVTSDTVVAAAAAEVGMDPLALAGQVRTDVQSGTTLIDVLVVDADPQRAVAAANAVADAMMQENRARQREAADLYEQAGQELLTDTQLDAPAAEAAREQAIGNMVGQQQGLSIQRSLSASTVDPASDAAPVGLGRATALVFGAAAGGLLGSLAVLSGAVRPFRRLRRRADLLDLRTPQRPRVATDVGTLAGVLLESDHSIAVLVECPGRRTVEGPSPTAAAVMVELRRQIGGAGLVLVTGSSPEPALIADSTWQISGHGAESLLVRAVRRELPQRLGRLVIVVSLASTEPAVELLRGQSDFFCAVIAPVGTRLSTVEAVVAPLTAADPVILVAPE